jgi:predicted SprT family Zn-dependent metalloprotease
MTITILAIVFLLLLLILAYVGQKLLTQKTQSLREANQVQCTICRNTFEKEQLIERQVGDFKILYFCRRCIESLHADVQSVN